jgi:HAD superfamily hydrolase (TIGR01509 family)
MEFVYRAVIFDMDGLMFDTERIARQGWQQAMLEQGYRMNDELYEQLVGRTIPDVRTILLGSFGSQFPLDQIYTRRQAYYQDYLLKNGVPIKPGLTRLLQLLKRHRIPLAVASSTPRAFGLKKLALAGLEDNFKASIFGDEVESGKPSPQIFLGAADRLKIPPQRCIVLEDSEAGIQAAHRAGMLPIMIPDAKYPSPDIQTLAYRVLPSLEAAIPLLGGLLGFANSPHPEG